MAVTEYKGCKFPPLARCPVPVEATVCYANQRITIEGELRFDRTEGSWKYGSQFQIHLFTKNLPKFDKRAENNGYTRIEIAVPLKLAGPLLEETLHELWQFLWKCQGVT